MKYKILALLSFILLINSSFAQDLPKPSFNTSTTSVHKDPMSRAVRSMYFGDGDVLEKIISENNLSINERTILLNWGVLSGNITSTKVLLDHGANPTLRNWQGKTTLEIINERMSDKIEDIKFCVQAPGHPNSISWGYTWEETLQNSYILSFENGYQFKEHLNDKKIAELQRNRYEPNHGLAENQRLKASHFSDQELAQHILNRLFKLRKVRKMVLKYLQREE